MRPRNRDARLPTFVGILRRGVSSHAGPYRGPSLPLSNRRKRPPEPIVQLGEAFTPFTWKRTPLHFCTDARKERPLGPCCFLCCFLLFRGYYVVGLEGYGGVLGIDYNYEHPLLEVADLIISNARIALSISSQFMIPPPLMKGA